MASASSSSWVGRAIPLWLIVVCAFAFHGPLLMIQVPANSFDANFHMSMASHYAHHWFDPWNEKAFAGFSQTTYPPLTHQWIAVFSHVIGMTNAFMLVQGIFILLLPVGVYGFARLWTTDRAASYAAFCSIFLGSLCLLVYQDGQIGTISATSLFLLSLPYLYRYVLRGESRDLVLGLFISLTAAAAHHATLFFGVMFFAGPVLWIAVSDYRLEHPDRSAWVPIRRLVGFGALAGVGIGVVLLPYFLILLKDPIKQIAIPHLSRANFLLEPIWGLHYWLVPWGAVVLALPYVFYKGGERRLRPLLLGFYFALLFGLGGTTPLPRWLLGRAFEILTFERFTYWALLLAMPFVGMLAVYLFDRFGMAAAGLLAGAVIATGSLAVAWNLYFPLIGPEPDVAPIVKFLNEPGRDQYRYLTLGYANAMSKIARYTEAPSVDGEYNSARTIPELTQHGVAQLSSAKFYHTEGMLALSDMLRHARRYGLRDIFVHDSYYNPILTFAGWRQIDSFNYGETTVWTTIGIPPATTIPSPLRPPRWQGIMWGTIPFGVSLATIVLAFVFTRKKDETKSERLQVGSATSGRFVLMTIPPEPSHASVTAPKDTELDQTCAGSFPDNSVIHRTTANSIGVSKSVVKNLSCSIVIPAYNEAKRLPRTLQPILAFIEAQGWDAEIIVVNDGSTDETAAVVRSFSARHPAVRLIDNRVNRGKGQSIRDGVLRATGDIILFADADNSTPIEDAEKLLQAIEQGADIAIGSRWVDRNLQLHPQPWHRRLNGRLYNLLLRNILGLDYKDTQNEFKAFTRNAAKAIFSLQRIGGWGFDAEVLYLAQKFGFTVREIPVEYTYYAEGSKIRPYRDGARMFSELLKVRWYAQTGAYTTSVPMELLPSQDLADSPLPEYPSE